MKIYSIISGLGLGGAEQCLVNLANGLLDRGYEFKIFTLCDAGLAKRSKKIQEITINLDCKKTFEILYKLYNKIKHDKSPVIISNFWTITFFVCLVKIFLKTDLKIIYWEHNSNTQRSFFENFLVKIAFRKIDLVIGWKKSINSIISICSKLEYRALSIGNPVIDPIVNSNVLKEKSGLICICSRLIKQKSIFQSLYLFLLLDQSKARRLLIIGDGEEKFNLIQMAYFLGILDKCIFIGHIEDPQKYIIQADVTLNLSKEEGFCNVAAETILCNTALISVENGSVASELLVSYPENGILIDSSNLNEAANAVGKFLQNYENNEGYHANIHPAKKYTIENWISRLVPEIKVLKN
jgi:glycosyltransferase involved in cell wall biosynthesis